MTDSGRRDLPLLAMAPLFAARCGAASMEVCRFEAANRLPLVLAGNLPFLAVTVNGQPVTALLDTGAEGTLVTETLLGILRMPVDPIRSSFQSGATGRTAPRRQVYLPACAPAATRRSASWSAWSANWP
jgi:hypothetical protein